MTTTPASDARPIVIVGSGLAGYTVARELRKLDKQTPLVVLSRDHAGFYSKPMLSQTRSPAADGGHAGDEARAEDGRELQATVRTHVEVQAIDMAARTLAVGGGETLAYRDLVLALGADPIRLPLDGDGAQDEVLSVNDLDDYALRRAPVRRAQRRHPRRRADRLRVRQRPAGARRRTDRDRPGAGAAVAACCRPTRAPTAAPARVRGVQFRFGTAARRVDAMPRRGGV